MKQFEMPALYSKRRVAGERMESEVSWVHDILLCFKIFLSFLPFYPFYMLPHKVCTSVEFTLLSKGV
jgi:hypothetical protein